MKTNQEYKNAALAALKGNWAPAVLATVIFFVIILILILPTQILSLGMDPAAATDPTEMLGLATKMLLVTGLTWIGYIFLLYPLEVGYYNAHHRLLVAGDNDLSGNLFRIAFDGYGRKVWGMFLVYLFTVLWSFLFIIPGIIKAFAYAMTPFILQDNPELSANEAIDRSQAMMKGHKFDLFYLYLGFLGWMILSIFTLGIGLLWLMPYMTASIAAFYEDVKAEYAEIAMD